MYGVYDGTSVFRKCLRHRNSPKHIDKTAGCLTPDSGESAVAHQAGVIPTIAREELAGGICIKCDCSGCFEHSVQSNNWMKKLVVVFGIYIT